VGTRISAPSGEAERCGDAGDDAGVRDGGAAMGVGRLEVGEEADGWAPSTREREGEEGNGRWWAGVGRKQGRAAGDWVGFAVFFLFFLFFFKSIFKPISNLFKFKSFTCFQIQILTQISPTILKAFHKPSLTTFQTYFKFKPLHKFPHFFTIIFKDFSQIF
jgi:hypothetical protein